MLVYMIARTVGELIARCYTLSEEEFLEMYNNPVLIGMGLVDVELLGDPDRSGTTLCLGFECATAPPGDRKARGHPTVGFILPIRTKEGQDLNRVTIGRLPENDIAVDDAAVSEVHGYIKHQGPDLIIGDLDSTNGTLVNGQLLKAPSTHVLRNEDVITLGRCSFQFFTPPVLYHYLQLCPSPPH